MNTTKNITIQDDCLFCKIARKEISSKIIMENSDILVFQDINPKAKIHYLIIPKYHIPTFNDLDLRSHAKYFSSMMDASQVIAKKEGFADFGYKLAINCNAGGGQEVFHLHLHLLSDFS